MKIELRRNSFQIIPENKTDEEFLKTKYFRPSAVSTILIGQKITCPDGSFFIDFYATHNIEK